MKHCSWHSAVVARGRRSAGMTLALVEVELNSSDATLASRAGLDALRSRNPKSPFINTSRGAHEGAFCGRYRIRTDGPFYGSKAFQALAISRSANLGLGRARTTPRSASSIRVSSGFGCLACSFFARREAAGDSQKRPASEAGAALGYVVMVAGFVGHSTIFDAASSLFDAASSLA